MGTKSTRKKKTLKRTFPHTLQKRRWLFRMPRELIRTLNRMLSAEIKGKP